jgi:uncharacterized protein YndB with AHSA1/START domain
MELEREDLEQFVRREIMLSCDRETAWRRLADAEGLRSWLADEVDLDLRPGAQGTIRLHDGQLRLVEVEEVQAQRRVCLIWREAGGEPSLVELTLEDLEQGTRLTVVELPIPALRAVAERFVSESQSGHGPLMLATAA